MKNFEIILIVCQLTLFTIVVANIGKLLMNYLTSKFN